MLSDITADMVFVQLGDGSAIEYSRALLEEVRRLAVTGFVAFGRGGLEIGGVLYGLRDGNRLTIHAFAECSCEHASGPAFVLSGADRQALARLLQAPAGLETLGWYRTHTRRGLDLDTSDRELFDQFPSGTRTIGLVVKPARWGPSSASFYLRDANGGVLPQTPQEFIVEPPGRSIEEPRRPEAERKLPIAESEPEIAPQIAPQIAPAFLPEPGDPLERPAKRRWLSPKVGLAAALIAAAALMIYYLALPPTNLALEAYAIAPGQVRISWSHRSRPVVRGASGLLQIVDGDDATRIPLDATQLRESSLTYTQKTGHLHVNLRVEPRRPGADPAEESIEFVGPPEAHQVAPVPDLAGKEGSSPAPASAASGPSPVSPSEPNCPPYKPGRGRRPAESGCPASTAQAQAASLPSPAAAIDQTPELQRPTPSSSQPSEAAKRKFQPPSPRSGTPAVAAPVVLAPPPSVPFEGIQAALPDLLPKPQMAPRPAPPQPQPKPASPRSGRLIWTGKLDRHGMLEIFGAHASSGSLTGALPAMSADIQVDPAEFTREGLVIYTIDGAANGRGEPPSKSNGWNAVEFAFDPVRVGQLKVLEAPNRANNFNRLVVLSESKTCPVIVVDWKAR